MVRHLAHHKSKIRNILGWKFRSDVSVKVLWKLVPQSQDHGNEEFDGRRQPDSFRKHIVVRPLDSQEQKVVDVPHSPRHGEERLIFLCEVFLGVAIEIVSALTFELHQRAEAIIIDRIQQILFGVSKSPKIFQGQVDTSLFGVGLDVAQDIRQLERNAKMNRVLFRRLVTIAKYLCTDQSDR